MSFRRRSESLYYEAYTGSGLRRNDKPAFYTVSSKIERVWMLSHAFVPVQCVNLFYFFGT